MFVHGVLVLCGDVFWCCVSCLIRFPRFLVLDIFSKTLRFSKRLVLRYSGGVLIGFLRFSGGFFGFERYFWVLVRNFQG